MYSECLVVYFKFLGMLGGLVSPGAHSFPIQSCICWFDMEFSGRRVHCRMGDICIAVGVLLLIFAPPIVYFGVSSWKKLSEEELSSALMKLFRSVTGVLGPILYISSASLRCIIQADENEPVIQQCGNPILPTFLT